MTTEAEETAKKQGEELGRHIAEMLKDHPGGATVKINPTPIPPAIASNILEFMRRVETNGMEAIAWVEAYTYVQQFVPQQPQPGVPFVGLPAPAPK